MDTVEVTFTITDKDLERLDRMAAVFASGDRDTFLRRAILHAELRDIQNYGAERAAELGFLDHDDANVVARVHRVLAARPEEADPFPVETTQQAVADAAKTTPARAPGDLEHAYDLWVDFMRMHDDGTLTASAHDVRPGLRLNVGDVITVGCEDAIPARAQVVRLDISGVIVVTVLDVARRHGQAKP